MGLPRAIKAHAANLLGEAEVHYRRAYEQGNTNEILYQNFGALLKKLGKIEESSALFEEGLKRYPKHPGIIRNYANQLRKSSPSYAIELYLRAIHLSFSNSKDSDMLFSCFDDLIELLREKNLLYWCQSLIQVFLSIREPSPILLKNILLIFDRLDLSSTSKEAILSAINFEIDHAPLKDAVSLDFALAGHYLQDSQHQRSLIHFEAGLNRVNSASHIQPADGIALQELIDTNSWNFACALLPFQEFERGWPLFEHGLRTPADGQQKWQRALAKPFSASELPLWRGQYDLSQRLLLLEEQAIGDCMMFISLVPALLSEMKHVGLFISPRLEEIYKRSFSHEISSDKISIFTKNNLLDNSIAPCDFDAQAPIGSICQHRFVNINSYSPRVPILLANEIMANKLRARYLVDCRSPKPLVGVSWRGGGHGVRIKQKSLDVQMFATLMLRHPDVRFINLQYGETSEQILAWQKLGIDIIHDTHVNPLKDMDLWLSQVKACDAVVSVANTTIHGAGGLNIPTQCLLSLFSDWRWLISPDVKRSYWYPSVGIARETRHLKSSWEDAFNLVSEWLDNGFPMPSGEIHSPMQ